MECYSLAFLGKILLEVFVKLYKKYYVGAVV